MENLPAHKELTEFHGESPVARKIDGSWQKISQLHRKLLEFCGKSPSQRETSRKLAWGLQSARNIDERFMAAREVDRRWWKLSQLHVKLTKVDRTSPALKESWRKICCLYGNLMELTEGILAARRVVKSWQKVSWPHEKLTEVDLKSPGGTKVFRSRRKVLRPHGKLTEFAGRSPGCTKVYGIWQVSQLHSKST